MQYRLKFKFLVKERYLDAVVGERCGVWCNGPMHLVKSFIHL